MPLQLLRLAEESGIIVEYWDFQSPLEAVYWAEPEMSPIIGLSKGLINNKTHLRTVLAEEIGHHFTSVRNNLPVTYYHYRDRLEVCREEYRALKWAADYLLPTGEFYAAVRKGINKAWMLAEYFEVDEELVRFKSKTMKCFYLLTV